MTSQRGLTLLEVLVALVVLSLVGLSYLQLLHGSHQLIAASRHWSEAVIYAEDAMERAKLGTLGLQAPTESLPGGFQRRITTGPFQPGLRVITVTVFLPGGGRFDLAQLTRVERAAQSGAPAAPPAPPTEPW